MDYKIKQKEELTGLEVAKLLNQKELYNHLISNPSEAYTLVKKLEPKCLISGMKYFFGEKRQKTYRVAKAIKKDFEKRAESIEAKL